MTHGATLRHIGLRPTVINDFPLALKKQVFSSLTQLTCLDLHETGRNSVVEVTTSTAMRLSELPTSEFTNLRSLTIGLFWLSEDNIPVNWFDAMPSLERFTFTADRWDMTSFCDLMRAINRANLRELIMTVHDDLTDYHDSDEISNEDGAVIVIPLRMRHLRTLCLKLSIAIYGYPHLCVEDWKEVAEHGMHLEELELGIENLNGCGGGDSFDLPRFLFDSLLDETSSPRLVYANVDIRGVHGDRYTCLLKGGRHNFDVATIKRMEAYLAAPYNLHGCP
ncbi:hypothetical protein HK101_002897 [Irineochytrium annulatum]|nr:hypothetical protein HK101_002897 [Irineochytrium annulatum]